MIVGKLINLTERWNPGLAVRYSRF
jgi:hypothetical protein